jgi:hypothetical protein
MDVERFDDLVRSLPNGSSRRRVLSTALGVIPGLLGLARLETSGHDALKKCKGKSGAKKKKCLKKAKKHNAQHQTEPECRNDGDCPDQVQFCQGGSCQTVCPSEACGACPICVVNLQSANDRARVCANQLIQVAPDSCSTDADCTGDEDDICVRISTGSCTQSPCGNCVSPSNVCV